MASEVLIKAEHVSKIFCRDLKKSLAYGVRDVAGEFFGRRRPEKETMAPPREDGGDLRRKEFWANRDISFEVRRGECLALLGRNGAGKTTLLKLLNGLIKPDRGRITMRGRVGALIALNAGFNPILTGRENIYVYGSVLGLAKKEIDASFDEILEFSELSDFIDTPLQSYSSGMQVRLGFAVATALQPDVLLIDEVLAVGDAAFRAKSINRLKSIANKCATIVVAHNIQVLANLCDTGFYLKEGHPVDYGPIDKVLATYSDDLSRASANYVQRLVYKHEGIVDAKFEVPKTMQFDESLTVQIKVRGKRKYTDVSFRAVIFDAEYQPVAEFNTVNFDYRFDLEEGEQTLTLKTDRIRLRPDSYTLEFYLHGSGDLRMIVRTCKRTPLKVVGFRRSFAPYVLGALPSGHQPGQDS